MIFEKAVVNIYKGMMFTRCDDTETVFYFSEKDFPGLMAEPYGFTAAAGHSLKGYIYQYDNSADGRLVVFDHGFGGGHRAYMKEIEKLCSHGYKVLAYDHTGCMESGGDAPNGLAQSLCDLNDCISALKSDERFKEYDISVMGHSWGGFSTLNITALHPEISHIVAMCGFVSVEKMIKTFFAGPLKPYRKAIAELERKSNPYFIGFDAVESLSASDVKALLIYSDNDKMCRKEHYDILKVGLESKDSISFMLVKNKGHNPNYTDDALRLLDDFSKKRTRLTRKKNLTKKEKQDFASSFDWNRMTEQDEEIWKRIFEHLDR